MNQEQFNEIQQEIQEQHQEMNKEKEKGMDVHDVIAPIMFIVFIVVFVLAFLIIFSSKFRGKMMSKQIKSLKHMVDDSKDDIEALGSTLGGVSARTRKKILDENEDILADVTQREANIKKGYVKTMAKAVKEGFSGDEETAFCKHCGASIDSDSTFCKKCGKKQ